MNNTWYARLRAFVRRVFFWLPSSSLRSEEQKLDITHEHNLLLHVTSPRTLPAFRQLRYAGRVLSTWEQRLLSVSVVVFLLSTGLAVGYWIRERTIRVPIVGGTFIEGVVGEPKYINPLDAAINDVDRDLVSLIFSGLFKREGLEIKPDLAEKYSWSSDGKKLTVTLRKDAFFHNGKPVTAEDVQFTIDSLQHPGRMSPLAPFFRGVKGLAVDSSTIEFTLERPDISFLEALTVGIIPMALWQDITPTNARLADLNLKPVGSGPYKLKSFIRDSRGSLRSYTLEMFDRYYGVKPFIKTLVFQFYTDRNQAEDALKADLIQGLAFATPLQQRKEESSRWHQVYLELPQETIAFFNVKQKIFTDEQVRRALAGVVDRQEIVDAWQGRAVPVSDPFPFADTTSTILTLDQARELLNSAGWTLPPEKNIRVLKPKTAPASTTKKPTTSTASSTPAASQPDTEFAFTILTSDQAELKEVAETLKRRWSLLGARVEIEIVSTDELLRRATRDHKADIVLTNVLLGPEQDLFPFWWSGQTGDRGFNISNLADRDVDTALEAIRAASTTAALSDARDQLSTVIKRSTPAVFLVRPFATYLLTKKILGVSPRLITGRPADRFSDIEHWYIETGWRWK